MRARARTHTHTHTHTHTLTFKPLLFKVSKLVLIFYGHNTKLVGILY